MDAIIRLIEGIVRGVISIIQPLIENGNLGYLIPFLLLGTATVFAFTNKNKGSLAGYMLGWVIAIAIIGLYLESNGDNLLTNLVGTTPRSEYFMPIITGFLIGFLALFPMTKRKLVDAAPIIVALITAVSVLLLFLAYRSAASFTVVTSTGVENLIIYRRRYVGALSVGFGAGVLLHLVMSSANPPKPPPTLPPAMPPQQPQPPR